MAVGAEAPLNAGSDLGGVDAGWSDESTHRSHQQELRQAVPTRLAAALGGTGALPVSVGEGRLRVSFDGGIPLRRADAAHGTSVR
ncbi:hypothetical protein A6P39_000955 [Streptomyces sp. FXJ1.172]|uniref:hypothetical protein n=1 Tax=Streptomyces sp. FXJ1.172 TaxID=710705 RepID=UPI0007CF45F7|nr:hypothetical protein [Streptomyces sp. FXJ1.172]WEO92800.1 hypothetical protein A6P39_000955 [Streptomyces sp. FXJ1.172]